PLKPIGRRGQKSGLWLELCLSRRPFSLYNAPGGRVPERLKGTRCKRVGSRLRWFESIPVHHWDTSFPNIHRYSLKLVASHPENWDTKWATQAQFSEAFPWSST